jgi:L-arabinokinase
MSSVPDSFFSREKHPRIFYRQRRLDVGMKQIDSINIDVPGTLADLNSLQIASPDLIEEEADFLVNNHIDLVLADLPPLAFEAAARAGIPSWGLSNFSWDWIYEEYVDDYPGFRDHIERISSAYALAKGLYRLPFWGGLNAFRNPVDVPLLARQSTLGKDQARNRLSLDRDRPAILFSFGGIKQSITAGSVGSDRCTLITSDPSPDPGFPFMHMSDERLTQANIRYCDLVAAADVVVTKLGYGIVSECIANRTAILHTPRERFREYPILAAGVKRLIPAMELHHEELLHGNWLEKAFALMNQLFPPPLACNGAEIIADHILQQ